jgi:hypothetical protein
MVLDSDLFRAYFAQLRQETAKRMLEKVFEGDSPAANKYWIAFSKKKFMVRTSIRISSVFAQPSYEYFGEICAEHYVRVRQHLRYMSLQSDIYLRN